MESCYREWAAWYAGDMSRLAAIYEQAAYFPTVFGAAAARKIKNEFKTAVHLPACGDIATTAAAMLFSEHPKIRIPGIDEDNPDPDVKATQLAVETLMNKTSFFARLLEAAESSSAMGGIFLKVNWRPGLFEYPIIAVAQPDSAVPEFDGNLLLAVNFWKVVEDDGKTVLRLIERHEPGYILNGLYKGTVDKLGYQIPLADHQNTAGMADSIKTGLPGLACGYVPNKLPNRMFRHLPVGQCDTAQLSSLMASLDQVYTLLVNEIRKAQLRIMVPSTYLEHDDTDGSMYFDMDTEVYVPMQTAFSDSSQALNDQIVANQFLIRTTEHLDAAKNLLQRIYVSAGYAPQSFGFNIEGGGAISGYALTIHERRSFNTTAYKSEHWKPAVEYILFAAQMVHVTMLGAKYTPMMPECEMQDSIRQDIAAVSQSIESLDRAMAVSLETKVAMAHPDWSREQRLGEVERIKDEQGMSLANPDNTPVVKQPNPVEEQ